MTSALRRQISEAEETRKDLDALVRTTSTGLERKKLEAEELRSTLSKIAKQNTELGALLTDAEAQYAAAQSLQRQHRGKAIPVKEDQLAELRKLTAPPA